MEFTDPACAKTLATYFCRKEVGAACPKLFYPDGLVAQAGTVLLDDGCPVAPNRNFVDNMGGGYAGLAEVTYDTSISTPDAFMVRRADLQAVVDRMREHGDLLTEAMELSFLLREMNRVVVSTAHAHATTHGSSYMEARDLSAAYGSAHALHRLWRRWPSMRADVLANPNVEYTSGYPRLNIERNEVAETKRIYTRRILSNIKHRILG